MSDGIYILSISVGVHDSCITISSEKEILLHLEAERVFHAKHMRCTPKQIIHLITVGLDYLQLHIGSISELVMATDDRRTGKLKGLLKGPSKREAIILGKSFKPLFSDHHTSHIATCSPSGFLETLIICADGGSREGSTKFYHKTENSIIELANFSHEIITGKFYGTVTQLVVNPDIYKAHIDFPGKTMGLAGWGEFSPTFHRLLDENRKELNQLHFDSVAKLRKLFGISSDYNKPWCDKKRRDLAFTAQKFWEDDFIKKIEKYANLSRNICLVGGCALNTNLNTKILNSGIFDNVYIPPVSSDSGQSLGAILHFFPEIKVCYPFLGRGFGEPEEIPPRVVDDLLEHKIVAWYQGRSEIGPRALGHRSFLGLPDSDAMRVKLSEKVKRREPYRPVSPIIIEKDVDSYFDFQSRSNFMNFVPMAKNITKKKSPAIVHKDGTSRIQTLCKKSNPILYGIIEELNGKGKPPILMNSSFNVMGQPIVDTPEDALRTFKKSETDVLYINGRRQSK